MTDAKPTLVIGNKAYSSWSFRPWIALRHAGVDFDEIVIPLDLPETRPSILKHSPAGKVPVLIDNGLVVWESIAILAHITERWPDARLLPADKDARSVCRSVAAEMHAGFSALRKACPMNMRRVNPSRDRGVDVAEDVRRITELWCDCRETHGAGGAFLFGHFTVADAMFAPVVSRFVTYAIATDPISEAYMEAVQALPAYQDWKAAAQDEPWVIDREEVD
ncbi:MAG: glutathione S-transferase family protein [Pseudomonadota bacterium]